MECQSCEFRIHVLGLGQKQAIIIRMAAEEKGSIFRHLSQRQRLRHDLHVMSQANSSKIAWRWSLTNLQGKFLLVCPLGSW